MFPESPGNKAVDAEYHRVRWETSTDTFNLSELGSTDIVRYDLTDGYIEGLPIPTGQDNPESYTHNRPFENRIESDTELDVRTLSNR